MLFCKEIINGISFKEKPVNFLVGIFDLSRCKIVWLLIGSF